MLRGLVINQYWLPALVSTFAVKAFHQYPAPFIGRAFRQSLLAACSAFGLLLGGPFGNVFLPGLTIPGLSEKKERCLLFPFNGLCSLNMVYIINGNGEFVKKKNRHNRSGR